MKLKGLLYLIVLVFTFVGLDSVNINSIFKKNKYYGARIFYLLIVFALTYLVVNFLYDFFEYTRII